MVGFLSISLLFDDDCRNRIGSDRIGKWLLDLQGGVK